MSEHEHVGGVFNIVQGSIYLWIATIFCEGANLSNPVSRVRGITVTAEGAAPLKLTVQPTPAKHVKALPNSVTMSAVWDPAACKSPTLLTPTTWPETRAATVQLDLELDGLGPGELASVAPEVRFQVSAPAVAAALTDAATANRGGGRVAGACPRGPGNVSATATGVTSGEDFLGNSK